MWSIGFEQNIDYFHGDRIETIYELLGYYRRTSTYRLCSMFVFKSWWYPFMMWLDFGAFLCCFFLSKKSQILFVIRYFPTISLELGTKNIYIYLSFSTSTHTLSISIKKHSHVTIYLQYLYRNCSRVVTYYDKTRLCQIIIIFFFCPSDWARNTFFSAQVMFRCWDCNRREQ